MKRQVGLELNEAKVSCVDEASSSDEVTDETLPEGEVSSEEAARLRLLRAGRWARLVEEARIRPAERAVIR